MQDNARTTKKTWNQVEEETEKVDVKTEDALKRAMLRDGVRKITE